MGGVVSRRIPYASKMAGQRYGFQLKIDYPQYIPVIRDYISPSYNQISFESMISTKSLSHVIYVPNFQPSNVPTSY